MIEHAQSELPNECCGLLAGTREGDALKVEACYLLVNEKASPTEYLSEPKSMLHADREMRRLGQDILAIYHSHPTSEPIPSKTDLERNWIPDAVHLIIGLHDPEPSVRGWWLGATSFEAAEWRVVEA